MTVELRRGLAEAKRESSEQERVSEELTLELRKARASLEYMRDRDTEQVALQVRGEEERRAEVCSPYAIFPLFSSLLSGQHNASNRTMNRSSNLTNDPHAYSKVQALVEQIAIFDRESVAASESRQKAEDQCRSAEFSLEEAELSVLHWKARSEGLEEDVARLEARDIERAAALGKGMQR